VEGIGEGVEGEERGGEGKGIGRREGGGGRGKGSSVRDERVRNLVAGKGDVAALE